MGKRRKAASKPSRVGSRAKEPKLVEGGNPACMPPPNHLVSVEDCDDMDHLGLYLRWPLVQLMDRGEDETLGVFVDTKRHRVEHCYQWKDHPPTWMDPHIFVDMLLKDERVQKVFRIAMKKNDPDAWKRIMGIAREVFDEQYLPYVMGKFEKAIPFLTQWALRCHATKETDPSKPKKKARRK